MVSTTILTLMVIPAIYAVVKEFAIRHAARAAAGAQENQHARYL
jgi:hypothetical protein